MADLVLGQSTMLRDRIGRALDQWSDDDVGYGYVLGMHAFGLEECNEYARAEALGLEALERNPQRRLGRACGGPRLRDAGPRGRGHPLADHRHLALAAGQRARGAQPLASGAAAPAQRRPRRGAGALRPRDRAGAGLDGAGPGRCQRAAVAARPARRRRRRRAGRRWRRAGANRRPGAGRSSTTRTRCWPWSAPASPRRSRRASAPWPPCRRTAPAPWWREAGTALRGGHGFRRRPLRPLRAAAASACCPPPTASAAARRSAA